MITVQDLPKGVSVDSVIAGAAKLTREWAIEISREAAA